MPAQLTLLSPNLGSAEAEALIPLSILLLRRVDLGQRVNLNDAFLLPKLPLPPQPKQAGKGTRHPHQP